MSDHITECPYHIDHASRIVRNEADIQTQFAKIAEALGLMYRVDKKLEGLNGKLIGVGIASASAASVVAFIVQTVFK